MPSLSARRAWIEIRRFLASLSAVLVALRKESVDRNDEYQKEESDYYRSLSARRAWIEIGNSEPGGHMGSVALRKESVDRNLKDSAPALLPAVALRKESVDRNSD